MTVMTTRTVACRRRALETVEIFVTTRHPAPARLEHAPFRSALIPACPMVTVSALAAMLP
jgi:hypothetical protein